jgi:hypothetical protein
LVNAAVGATHFRLINAIAIVPNSFYNYEAEGTLAGLCIKILIQYLIEKLED